MKNLLQITKKNGTITTIEGQIKKTYATTVIITDQFTSKGSAFLLCIGHQKTNTFIELSHAAPCLLVYFDEGYIFRGASICSNIGNSPFAVQIQHKKVLFLPYGSAVPFRNIVSLKINKP